MGDQFGGGGGFNDVSQIHHQDLGRNMFHDRQIVSDE
jgi:hypothetical protein